MVVYLDDMLFLHQWEEHLLETRNLVLALAENLGFLINYMKSELSPVQKISFLGFTIDSQRMMIKLPSGKVEATMKEAKKSLNTQQTLARQLAHMVGVFSATLPAVLPAPIHYRELQALKHRALQSGGHSSVVNLSEGAKNNLVWWISYLDRMNGQPIHQDQQTLTITSDASLLGWGAHCDLCKIGGP